MALGCVVIGFGLDLGGSTPVDGLHRLVPKLTTLCYLERRLWFLQASARAHSPSRGGCGDEAWVTARPCTGRARRGGAHGRAQVRTRVNPRARQRVRRRHAALGHRDALEIEGGTLRELIKKAGRKKGLVKK